MSSSWRNQRPRHSRGALEKLEMGNKVLIVDEMRTATWNFLREIFRVAILMRYHDVIPTTC